MSEERTATINDNEQQTAMLLTEQEWADLATIVSHYRNCCIGWACSHHHGPYTDRLRTLIDRIVDAVESPLNGADNGSNCPTCNGTGLVPFGLPSNGPDPCPDCGEKDA